MELSNYDWLLIEPFGHASFELPSWPLPIIQRLVVEDFERKLLCPALLASGEIVCCSCSKPLWLFRKMLSKRCLTAFLHISNILMDILLSDDVESISISIEALQQVNLTSFNAIVNSFTPLFVYNWQSISDSQNLTPRNRSPVYRKGYCCRPFQTCTNCKICCCLGTGGPISTIMAKKRASMCACPPNETERENLIISQLTSHALSKKSVKMLNGISPIR